MTVGHSALTIFYRPRKAGTSSQSHMNKTIALYLASLVLLAVIWRAHSLQTSMNRLVPGVVEPVTAVKPTPSTIPTITSEPFAPVAVLSERPAGGATATPALAYPTDNKSPGLLPAAAAAFHIAGLEISQGIQNSSQPVPLIAGKPTIVRAYLQSEEGAVAVAGGLLRLSLDGGLSWLAVGADNGPATAVPAAEATAEDDRQALRFTFPLAATQGTVLLYVTAQSKSGATVASATLSAQFEPVQPFRVAYLPLKYNDALPDNGRISQAHGFMQLIYPLAEVDYYPLPLAAAYEGGKAGHEVTAFLRQLWAVYELAGWPAPLGTPDQLFGWVPDATWRLDGGSDPDWFNNGSSRVSFGSDTARGHVYQLILAHEIGHNLGREHPLCRNINSDWPHDTHAIQDTGFDFGYYEGPAPIIAATTDDFMIGSHCRADLYADKWVSSHNFRQIHEAIARRSPANPVSQTGDWTGLGLGKALARGKGVYLVSGRLYSNGTAELNPIYQLTPGTAVFQQNGSDYCLNLEDSAGQLLQRTCFDLSLADVERHMPHAPALFNHVLPSHTAAARLTLSRGAEVLAVQLISAHAPVVELQGPPLAEPLAGLIDWRWQATDADGDALHYLVSYTPDNGRNWYHLGLNLKQPELQVDMATLPGGNEAYFRVMASDGSNTTAVVAGPYRVANRPPEAVILLPHTIAQSSQGSALILRGHGFDLEDGLLGAANLSWYSDRDGYLGNGRTLTLNSLTAGEHTITLTASDHNGQQSSATAPVTISQR
jgi:hypothetical protein